MSATVAICVPVRNEEALLPTLLSALADQRDCDSGEIVACFFLDGCTDDSAAILRAAALPMPIVIALGQAHAEPNAGRARRAAMALGLERLRSDGVLLSTDADSRPHDGWVAAARRALALADVAAGRIVAHDPAQARLERLYDRLHRHRRVLDPVAWDSGTGHHHAGGANLAIRADVYHALGGFQPLPAGEDAALLDDAARAGFRVRHDVAMVVDTSARRIGRVDGGLASWLRQLDRAGPGTVAHPADLAWQWRGHAAARAAFARIDDARAGAVGRVDRAEAGSCARRRPRLRQRTKLRDANRPGRARA